MSIKSIQDDSSTPNTPIEETILQEDGEEEETTGKLRIKEVLSPTRARIYCDPIEHSIDNPIQQPKRETERWVQYEPVSEKLTVRQERFCQLYTGEGSFFGNGVQAYLEVYDIDTDKPGWYKTACAAASQILSNIKVCNRINELLSDAGLNKEFMDKQLLFVATQNADFTNKMWAIKEYNRITKRVDDSPKMWDVIIVDASKLRNLKELKERIK